MPALDEVFPWDHLDAGVTKQYLARDYQASLRGETRRDCREQCYACGILAAFGEERAGLPEDAWGCPTGCEQCESNESGVMTNDAGPEAADCESRLPRDDRSNTSRTWTWRGPGNGSFAGQGCHWPIRRDSTRAPGSRLRRRCRWA